MQWRGGGSAPVDWLVVGLGNPGTRYAGTRHNVGFDVANALGARWDLPKAKTKYRGLFTEGRAGIGGPRVALLLPQTYMNEAGESVGPARGALKVPLERVLVLHDEIDLPVRRHPHARRRRPGRPQRPEVAAPRPRRPRLRPRADRRRAARLDRPRHRRRLRPRPVHASRKADVQDLVDRARDAAEALVLGDPV